MGPRELRAELLRRKIAHLDAISLIGDNRREAKAEGIDEGKRQGILDLCEAYGVALTDQQRARLEMMKAKELEAFRQALKQERSWPNDWR